MSEYTVYDLDTQANKIFSYTSTLRPTKGNLFTSKKKFTRRTVALGISSSPTFLFYKVITESWHEVPHFKWNLQSCGWRCRCCCWCCLGPDAHQTSTLYPSSSNLPVSSGPPPPQHTQLNSKLQLQYCTVLYSICTVVIFIHGSPW